MSIKIKYVIGILFLLYSKQNLAQSQFGLLMEGKQMGQFAIEANPIINIKYDYLYKFDSLKLFGQPLGFGGSVSIPPFAQQEGFDINYSLGATSIIPIKNKWKILTSLNLNFYHISDLSASYFSYGPQIDFFPGHYSDKWILATHFSFDYRPFVNIKHKEFSKEAFENLYPNGNGTYTGPKDGWFYQNHHFGNYGIALAFLKARYNINFTLDYSCPLTELGFKIIPELGMLPFSSTIGFNYIIN